MKKSILFSLSLALFFSVAQATPPEQVQNVAIISGNSEISLSWDEADDEDGIVTDYKIFYGQTSFDGKANKEYTEEKIVESGANTLKIKGLENDKAYFFAIKAIDDELEESGEFSTEVSATPRAPDLVGPSVSSAKITEKNLVLIEFSEPIKTDVKKESVKIINDDEVSVQISDVFVQNNQILIELTDNIVKGKMYKFIGNREIVDLYDNEMRNPEEEIAITEEIATANEDAAEEGTTDEEPLSSAKTPIDEELDFPSEVLEDSKAPQDVQGIAVNSSNLSSKKTVLISWKKALDLDNDIADQILYTQKNNSDWDGGVSLGKDENSLNMSVELNKSYKIKIVVVDGFDNASDGKVFSFSTKLSKSGSDYTFVWMILVFSATLILSLGFRKN